MNYQILQNGVMRLSDGASIPRDTANRDYVEYLKWVAAGNEADPASDGVVDDVLAEEPEQVGALTVEALVAVLIAKGVLTEDDLQKAIQTERTP